MKIYNKYEDTYIYPDTIKFYDLWLGIKLTEDFLYNTVLFKVDVPIYAIKVTAGKLERPYFITRSQFNKFRKNIENDKDIILDDFDYSIGIKEHLKDILNSKIEVKFLNDFSLEMEKDFKENYLKGYTYEDFFKMILDLIPAPKDNKVLYKFINKFKNKKYASMETIYWNKDNCSCSLSYRTLNSL